MSGAHSMPFGAESPSCQTIKSSSMSTKRTGVTPGTMGVGLIVTDANFVHQSVSDPSSTFNELTGVVPASNPAGVTAINGESSNTNSPSVTVRNPLPDGGPDPAAM